MKIIIDERKMLVTDPDKVINKLKKYNGKVIEVKYYHLGMVEQHFKGLLYVHNDLDLVGYIMSNNKKEGGGESITPKEIKDNFSYKYARALFSFKQDRVFILPEDQTL